MLLLNRFNNLNDSVIPILKPNPGDVYKNIL